MIAKKIPYPKKDILFIKSDIYDYWIYYELSIASYYVKNFKFGYECCRRVLCTDPNNDFIVGITINNLKFYVEHASKDSMSNITSLINIIESYFHRHPESQEKHQKTLDHLKSLME